MVGGAGAGLTHQPNTILEMMHNTIQNDLTAQQNSKTNAVNFLNARIAGFQGLANARNVASHTATNDMNNAVLHYINTQAGILPPGPFQQKYIQAAQGLGAAVQGWQNTQNNAKGTIAAQSTPEAAQNPANFTNGVNTKLLTAMSAAHSPLAQQASQEGQTVQQARQEWKNYLAAYKQLLDNSGQGGDFVKPLTTGLGALVGGLSSGGIGTAAGAAIRHAVGGLAPSLTPWRDASSRPIRVRRQNCFLVPWISHMPEQRMRNFRTQRISIRQERAKLQVLPNMPALMQPAPYDDDLKTIFKGSGAGKSKTSKAKSRGDCSSDDTRANPLDRANQ